MKCINCGNEIEKEDKFCTKCGTKVENVANERNNENDSKMNAEFSGRGTKTKKKIEVKTIIALLIIAYFVYNCIMAHIEVEKRAPKMETMNVTSVSLDIEPIKLKWFVEELHYEYPNTYELDSSMSSLITAVHMKEEKNNELFGFNVMAQNMENDIAIEGDEIFEIIDDSIYQEQDFSIENFSETTSEEINGVTWYKKSCMQKSDKLRMEIYEEFYLTIKNGKVYVICFKVGTTNGKKMDTSKVSEFSDIKNSLKFEE